ncbi:DNA glycosylase AlkZ-like family protein [Actinokineospora sp. G85]|uniref:DNA glycosylase AlkZ-like family protein n=1 Tax=Actinokineospora sp. G85 TaxID=3406626 RepID=UPI003C749295
MRVSRQRVRAYRVARHGLLRDGVDAVLDLGVQDAGAHSPAVALAARGLSVPDPVTVWAARGAPHVLRRADVAGMAAALWPRSDADAYARLGAFGSALRKAGVGGVEAVRSAASALRAVVSEEKPRGQVSAEVTAALPPVFSSACEPCGSTHVYGSLFQVVGVFAGVEVDARRRPTLLRPLPGRHEVPSAVVGSVPEAYLRVHGPSTLAAAAAYLGTTQTAARPGWPGGLVEVDVEGVAAWVPESEVAAVRSAEVDPGVVRLLPPSDPFLQGRDREVLAPGVAARVWRVIGGPGVVLVGADVVGTWRAKQSGARLALSVEPFAALSARVRREVEAEALVVAGARGAATVEVAFG